MISSRGLVWEFAGNAEQEKMPSVTWSEQDDRHGDEGADHQDDQQGDGDPFPVPLRRAHPTQVLQRENMSGQNPVKKLCTLSTATSSISMLMQQQSCT